MQKAKCSGQTVDMCGSMMTADKGLVLHFPNLHKMATARQGPRRRASKGITNCRDVSSNALPTARL